MKAENINPFVVGAQKILTSVCNSGTSLGKLYLKPPTNINNTVAVAVGIIGDLKGHVVITMQNDTACYVASKMMFGMEVTTLDAMSQSAISELGNMISGNAATIFSVSGKTVDITPPVCTLNATPADVSFIPADEKFICIPIIFENGLILEMNVSVK